LIDLSSSHYYCWSLDRVLLNRQGSQVSPTDFSLQWRHGKRAALICTNSLSSNVRIKRSRRSPEISILHHICDRWSGVDHRYWRVNASLPTVAAVAAVWVAPLKFDAVFMRFELPIRESLALFRAELLLYSTTQQYKRVSSRRARSHARGSMRGVAEPIRVSTTMRNARGLSAPRRRVSIVIAAPRGSSLINIVIST